jgi:hypothetical protein
MEELNYNELYANHLMCRNCNRKTNGIEDYKNNKTGKVTKTCAKCRDCVLKSLAKNPQHKPLTLKQQIQIMKEVLKTLEPETLNDLYEQKPQLKTILTN